MYAHRDLIAELTRPTEWVTNEVGLSDEGADKLVNAYRAELLAWAADELERREAMAYPGVIWGAIRRMRANYYANLLRQGIARNGTEEQR